MGNHMNLRDEVDQVVIHELIHAYDDCRAANLDWANCAHHACSELYFPSLSIFFPQPNSSSVKSQSNLEENRIRAGHLSGDCHYKRELLRGFMKIRGHEQECVRRRVMKSVIANPYCSESAARDAMEAVWDVCYNDTKPFDRAP
ncbi:Mitochondrial inner membrane protease atp23 [Asimina triloba]